MMQAVLKAQYWQCCFSKFAKTVKKVLPILQGSLSARMHWLLSLASPVG